MTHDEARELIGANPDEASAELLAHLHTCPECQAYRKEMLALNAKLRRALELDWQKVQKSAPPDGPPTGAAKCGAPPLPTDRPNVTADTAKRHRVETESAPRRWRAPASATLRFRCKHRGRAAGRRHLVAEPASHQPGS